MTLESHSLFLGIVAASLHGVGYIVYNIQTEFGKSKPNPVSWSFWAFLAIINVFTYNDVSGSFVLTMQYIVGSFACSLTFLWTLARGNYKWPSLKEWGYFLLGLIAFVVWLVFKNAIFANMIVLVSFVFTFIPTIKGVIQNPEKESPWSWVLWTTAFFLTCLNVCRTFDGNIYSFISPFVMLILHGSIIVLSMREKKS